MAAAPDKPSQPTPPETVDLRTGSGSAPDGERTAPTVGRAFGDYELDTRLHELRRAGERLHVEPQVFDVLVHLFASRDRLVTKDELLDRVWGHRYVAPTTLNSRIKHARQAVGDDGTAQRVIKTVHGLGFRVVAHVVERNAADAGDDRSSANTRTREPANPRPPALSLG